MMTTEPKEQHVLLTEGSFVEDEAKHPTQDQEVATPVRANESSEQPPLKASEPVHSDPPASPPGKPAEQTESSRPVTAPDSIDVELSIDLMGVVSAGQSLVSGGDGAGDEFQETLSEKLGNVPSEAGDAEEDEYVAPPEDPYMRAVNYMEKHKVMQIFQKLTAEIVYHRPPDPLEHMLSELTKMKKERDDRIEAIISSASSHAQGAV